MGINFAWFLLSLTIIFLPPATAALYDIAFQSYYNQVPSLRNYFAAMRKWFWISYLWAISIGVLVGLSVSSIIFYRSQDIFIGQMIGYILLMVLAPIQFYFWPYMLAQSPPNIFRALRNSIFTILGDITLFAIYGGISFIFGVPAVVMIAPMMFIVSIFIAMLGTYSLIDWLYIHDHLEGERRVDD